MLYSYLSFNGNCRQAMEFYKDCFNGSLRIQTIGESPLSDKMPTQMKNFILHASLTTKSFIIMATDMVCENGLKKGNNISLALQCNDEKEMKHFFEKLSHEGVKKQEIKETFYGSLFGEITDKFGFNWILNFNKNS